MSSANIAPLHQTDTLEARLSGEVRAMLGRRRQTQGQLAAVLGITQGGVSARLRGDTDWKIAELDAMARWFGVSPAYLLGLETQRAPDPYGSGAGLYTTRDLNPEPADLETAGQIIQLPAPEWKNEIQDRGGQLITFPSRDLDEVVR